LTAGPFDTSAHTATRKTLFAAVMIVVTVVAVIAWVAWNDSNNIGWAHIIGLGASVLLLILIWIWPGTWQPVLKSLGWSSPKGEVQNGRKLAYPFFCIKRPL
jgi:hypothetical protein